MLGVDIIQYRPEMRDDVVDITIRAWDPVFQKTQNEVPRFVYDAFYPDGWKARQSADVRALLDAEPETIWVATQADEIVGFIGISTHPEDRMGAIYILAVSPDHQRQGVGRRLMEFAEARLRAEGLEMMTVETIADSGHLPARKAYEAFGFDPWPVARYFKKL